MMAPFALTIFLSAFLLFQVQPLIGKHILPWYGGGPAVWTTCMLFFQTALLAGYGYAHLVGSRLRPRAQGLAHLALLAASLLFLPVVPRPEVMGNVAPDEPVRHILHLLLRSVGLPYVLLSSTAPLLQRWTALSQAERSPYRLYALANAGSLLALLSYPFAVEPLLGLRTQAAVWSAGYVLFAAGCVWCVLRLRAAPHAAAAHASEASAGGALRPTAFLLWIALAACGSALLLATTNQMTQEVAAFPFLWVMPLALYLLSYMLCFDSDRWYSRVWFGLLAGILAPAATGVTVAGVSVPLWAHVMVDSAALFVCCMACHGELVRARPTPRHLTLFYLSIALGGALGGVFVALAAPVLFTSFDEFYLALGAAAVMTLAGWYRSRAWRQIEGPLYKVIAPVAGLATAALIAGAALAARETRPLAVSRNFYGVLRVTERADAAGTRRVLTHGRIMHGSQLLDSQKRRWPTTYFGPDSGAGLLLRHYPRNSARKVGIIGLGAGTLAAYGQPGDVFRFYEINPDVQRIAGEYFSYLKDSGARVDVVLGDARVRLEQEAARGEWQRFDVFAIDAFSSDAIPAHLLTAEAADDYRRHLKPDGAMAFHISNRSLDLSPVVRALAQRLGWQALRVVSAGNDARDTNAATWVIVTANPAVLDALRDAALPWADDDPPPLLWTDDYASVWRVLK